MQLIKLTLLAVLSSYVAAQDVDNSDVPQQCREVCQPTIQLSQTCDRQNDDDDGSFINCVCSAENAATLIPLCEACVANYDRDDGADNDVNDLVRSCSFTRSSFVSGATTAPAGAATTTGSSTSSVVTTTAPSGESTTATTAPNPTSSTTDRLGGTAVTNSDPSNTGNAAPGLSTEMGLMASLFLGALGFVGLA